MEEKQIKILKKQMPIWDWKKCAVYFRDMAAEGKILDEVGYLFYYFREGEPQDLRYETKVFEDYPTETALAEFTEKGWRLVSHWELEYVFVTERADAPPLFQQEEDPLVQVEREIQAEEERAVRPDFWMLILILISFGVAVFINGFKQETLLTAAKEVKHLLLLFLFGSVVHIVRKRRLQKKKERLLEEKKQQEWYYAEEEPDWRSSYRRRKWGLCLLIVIFGGGVYYLGHFNEKTFDLPQEISYEEIPAVRAERLATGDWIRIGESVDLSQEGLHLPTEIEYGADTYRNRKRQGELYNFGVTSRYLPSLESKVFTTQYLEEAELGETAKMETTYYKYRLELLAERKFEKEEERNMGGSGIYTGDEIYWKEGTVEFLDAENDKLDDLHVCMVRCELGERLHILARQGDQLMEVKYSGTADAETILKEIEAVFSAQEK